MYRIYPILSCLLVVGCILVGCSLKDAEDSVTICGEGEINCLDIDEHLDSVACIKGYCRISACKKGFHVHKNKMACESDTNDKCGWNQENCERLGLQCSNGECRTECDESLTQCPNGCFDITKDKDHCGDCSTKCDDITHGYSKCENAACVVYCERGYHSKDDTCIANDNETTASSCTPQVIPNGVCECASPGDEKCSVRCDAGFKPYEKKMLCICEGDKYEHGACACENDSKPCVVTCDAGYTGEKCDECAEGWGNHIGGSQCVKFCRDHADCTDLITEDNSIGQCDKKTGMCTVVQCPEGTFADENGTKCIECLGHIDCANTQKEIDKTSIWQCVENMCKTEQCPKGTAPNEGKIKCLPTEVEPVLCACKIEPGVSKHECDKDGNCYAVSCASEYHLYEKTCEADTVENCGVHGNDCNSHPGVLKSQCVDGLCEATKCDSGYGLIDKTCRKKLTLTCSGKTPYVCNESWCCASESDCYAPYTQCRAVLVPIDPELPLE